METEIFLYHIKDEFQKMQLLAHGNTVSVSVSGKSGWSMLLSYDRRAKVDWFVEMIADQSEEVGRIYTSSIDEKTYTEYFEDLPEDELVVLGDGQLSYVAELPPEEY